MPSPSKGWYRHCGPGCGNHPDHMGGGTPINPVDTCCRGHDCCWARFISWDCECDKILIDCATLYRWRYPFAYETIVTAFKWNTIFC